MSQSFLKLHQTQQLMPARVRTRRCLFVAFCYALIAPSSSCVKLPRHARGAALTMTTTVGPSAPNAARRININTAPRAELESLPGIGAGLATRIIEHRERYGPFRRVEHLIIVRGFSERRFTELQPFIEAR
jgi:competence ComEA-like helix-hairpin-helix protein